MDIQYFRSYCLAKNGATEETPFDFQTLCFKVGGKIFALTDIDNFVSINLKCDPEWAVELREEFDGILPGFHMNKKHWNTVRVNSSVSDQMILKMVDHSYELVFNQLPLKIKSILIP
jgi:predicted DNA-binding protein (MmcQ/YjbR family)